MSDLTPFPETIAGARIVSTRRVPSRPGELPELAVIIGQYRDRPEERSFAVWNASVRDGEWTAFEGDYDLTHGEGWKEFYRRISNR